jgi:hypothetical protein
VYCRVVVHTVTMLTDIMKEKKRLLPFALPLSLFPPLLLCCLLCAAPFAFALFALHSLIPSSEEPVGCRLLLGARGPQSCFVRSCVMRDIISILYGGRYDPTQRTYSTVLYNHTVLPTVVNSLVHDIAAIVEQT